MKHNIYSSTRELLNYITTYLLVFLNANLSSQWQGRAHSIPCPQASWASPLLCQALVLWRLPQEKNRCYKLKLCLWWSQLYLELKPGNSQSPKQSSENLSSMALWHPSACGLSLIQTDSESWGTRGMGFCSSNLKWTLIPPNLKLRVLHQSLYFLLKQLFCFPAPKMKSQYKYRFSEQKKNKIAGGNHKKLQK